MALLQQGGAVSTAACVAGGLSAAALLAVFVQRIKATPYDPSDWPGAKAWPAGMTLISFFELAVFTQALLQALR